ncbi:rho guanine nucleotide exchange factor 37 isoform X1 [Leucoraja erinacea]|uniref:rho guanine nucleotide exchange factor 37 isoform X1 n=1 Tax=Leucoraja erinaceus TaxID=7782 RepID=UPI002454C58C|nr:rho guanine nucleotide exchange factor 37 isoform X1 [Leucoraja erinacea]XP_055499005.1 rho guanine nucleotide exchange factor 37 isoform X1 [Leucoraja erinacea]XP_055499007.1 rho guanine nucleotide exchange factor 37 isoform X1 [Leucoraja erinacea]
MDDSSYYEEIDTFSSPSKMEQKQMKAIDELISSEERYLTLLQLCATDIRNHLQSKQVPDLDLEGLFGNIDDVIFVSSNLLKHLEDTATGNSDQLLLISNVFLTFKQELEDVYKVYCVNYDNILLLESIYKKNENILKEITESVKTVKSHTGAMTLTFYLVMPVQRVLKYPLLLDTILKNTPQSDEGYEALEKATKAMQEVNININEYKGLKEVANKYIRAEHLSLMDSICRINPHSISKKASRLSQVIKHETGILPKTKDKDFDGMVKLFNIIEKDVTTLKKNAQNYLTNVEHFQQLNPCQDFSDLVDEHVAACYQGFIEKLYQQVIPEFKRRFESIIYEPLCVLASLFGGPQQLVRKHKDKMLDCEKIQEKIKQEGDASYDEKAAVKTYETLHSLLLTELPRFNIIVLQLQEQILQAIINMYRELANNVLELINQYLHEFLPNHEYNSQQQTVETLEKSIVKLEEFSQIFESIMEQLIEQPLNQEKLNVLLKKYNPSKIYQVTSNISGSKDLDLTLQMGDFVAILQSTDTKGKANRWLVDSGGRRGFVPAGKLSLYQPEKEPDGNKDLLGSSLADIGDGTNSRRRSCHLPETLLSLPPSTMRYQVIAAYHFAARGPHEANLQPGELVTILEAHDKRGSTEWYLVEVNGQKGYVPSNYLTKVSVTGGRNSFAL